ncbi:hypothetical protein [Haloarcula laminariae]|uniref:hypothetical protein n=1 Tax=Haloarcula laminariae TaxID=2961577 RepID=UPI0021C9D36E|nr:hypothetical protein [Halomicroarcula laminariae]
MTNYYCIRGPIKGIEHPEDSPMEGPVFDEFVVTATSQEAALEKHQTHCEELGIELEDLTVEVLDEYLDEGDQLFGVEDTIWRPGDSAKEIQREQPVDSLTPIHTGILSTIHWMNKNNDTPVSTERIVEQYESNHDRQLDPSKVPKLFDELLEGDFAEREREEGVGVYSMTPERVRELRRYTLKQARLYEWAGRNLAGENDE